MKRILTSILLLLFLTSCIFDRHGVMQGRFHLSETSRLPVWVVVPQGMKRAEITVYMTEYGTDNNERTKWRFVVKDERGRTIQTQIGYSVPHPDSKAPIFPYWDIFDVNGSKEVYAQLALTNVLSIVDKPIPANYQRSDGK